MTLRERALLIALFCAFVLLGATRCSAGEIRSTIQVSATVLEIVCTPEQIAAGAKCCANIKVVEEFVPAIHLAANGQVEIDLTETVLLRTIYIN